MPWKFGVPILGYRLALEDTEEGEDKEICHVYPNEYVDAPEFFTAIHHEDANKLQTDRKLNQRDDWCVENPNKVAHLCKINSELLARAVTHSSERSQFCNWHIPLMDASAMFYGFELQATVSYVTCLIRLLTNKNDPIYPSGPFHIPKPCIWCLSPD